MNCPQCGTNYPDALMRCPVCADMAFKFNRLLAENKRLENELSVSRKVCGMQFDELVQLKFTIVQLEEQLRVERKKNDGECGQDEK